MRQWDFQYRVGWPVEQLRLLARHLDHERQHIEGCPRTASPAEREHPVGEVGLAWIAQDGAIWLAVAGVDVAFVADVEVLPREPPDAARGVAPGHFGTVDELLGRVPVGALSGDRRLDLAHSRGMRWR
jgi:hypothetical protein